MAEPLTTAELKAQLRKTTTDEDALIASYGVAAREWCEDYTGHILVQREVEDKFSAWGDYLTLRYRPIAASPELVVSFEDVEGDDTDYEGLIRDQNYPWLVYPVYGFPFPTLASNGTITATYTAGYADAASVPEKFKWAIKLLVTAMFNNRGSIDEESERAVRFILRSYRGAVMA